MSWQLLNLSRWLVDQSAQEHQLSKPNDLVKAATYKAKAKQQLTQCLQKAYKLAKEFLLKPTIRSK
jgi:hypothetical protein